MELVLARACLAAEVFAKRLLGVTTMGVMVMGSTCVFRDALPVVAEAALLLMNDSKSLTVEVEEAALAVARVVLLEGEP